MKHRKKHLPSIGMVLTACALLLTLAGCGDGFAENHVGLEARAGSEIQLPTPSKSDSRDPSQQGADTQASNALQPDSQAHNMQEAGISKIEPPRQNSQGSGSQSSDIQESNVQAADTAQDAREPGAVVVTAADLAGPWHLEPEENDEAAVNETFPGAMEFGSTMEITNEGKISWYIGADGGSGTYTLDGNVLSASMTNAFDGRDMTVDFTAEKDGDQILLAMEYKGLTLRWAWGTWETGKGEE